eukprot:gnl/TRDRNA2_/TRDRNA2_35092_c0_seq1.p1 gnl/TRDRNA2_/TRDRNA2_35092_c0~~gnl/TRDRNA2_/TRDRNA2_35092_c0_seq1.p1  ORF type:complete len:712 (-),score=86.45 gnl/TRDRNA2_/TRDRNA2_35092_c0_seq1:216-2282(-)
MDEEDDKSACELDPDVESVLPVVKQEGEDKSDPKGEESRSMLGHTRRMLLKCCRKRSRDCEDPEAPLPSFWRLVSLSRNEWPGLVFASVLMILHKCAELTTPWIFGEAIDSTVSLNVNGMEGSGHQEKMQSEEVKKYMFYLFLAHTCASMLGAMQGFVFGLAGARVVARLRCGLFGAIMNQEIGYICDVRKSGELMSRLGDDTGTVERAVTKSLAEIASHMVSIGVALGFMLAARWQLCALMLGIAPLLLFTAVPFGKFIGTKSKQYQDVKARYSDISQEAIGNMRTVRSFAAEDYDVSRYCRIVGNPDVPGASYCWWPRKDGSSLRQKAILLSLHSTFGACTGWLTVTYVMFVVWYAFDLVVDGEMRFGELSAFLMYGMILLGAIAAISHNISSVFEARGASARIFELMDREPLVPNKGGEHRPEKIRGDVQFKAVKFSYPSRLDIPVLTGVSFHVHADSMAAFVGASGSGKSTILCLLQRFYEATEGEILIDGVNLKNFDAFWLRRQMAFVQQEPVLFGTSIRDNLLYGCYARAHSLGSSESTEVAVSSWSDEHLQKACEQANAYSFISNFPEGFATLVGERGIKLSGGQKQRLAIARAILCDPRVLLLDEATSALDAESEHLVKEALDNLMKDRTRLVVAHRLSTVREADQIMVVEGGRIADCGRHEELLVCCQSYELLVKRQLQ